MIEVYGSKIFIKDAGGSSAVNLLGRFSYEEGPLNDHVTNIIQIEERINKDKILAEIVHLPEARTGNILQRPHIRNYEIPYLGHSKLERKNQIPINDLMVSVKNNSLILHSKKLGKEILPRLGNAHNYSGSSLPVYQFLCELQSQNKRPWIGFDWNVIHKKQSFLPRVVFGDIIFSKALWNIETAAFKSLFKSKHVLTEVEIWQHSLQLPDHVELVEGDNKLLIYLKSKASVTMLLHTVKSKSSFSLEEFLFENKGVVNDQKGNTYCNQFVVSFYNKEKLERVANDGEHYL
jgi:REP element-mobilizing transposase RayT